MPADINAGNWMYYAPPGLIKMLGDAILRPKPKPTRADLAHETEAGLVASQEAADVARIKYRTAERNMERASRAVMEADLDRKPTYGPICRSQVAQGRLARARDALLAAQHEQDAARRRFAAVCQGTI